MPTPLIQSGLPSVPAGLEDKEHRLLTPLYLARVASFVEETRTLSSAAVEEKIERLCLKFEELRPYLLSQWAGDKVTKLAGQTGLDGSENENEMKLEV